MRLCRANPLSLLCRFLPGALQILPSHPLCVRHARYRTRPASAPKPRHRHRTTCRAEPRSPERSAFVRAKCRRDAAWKCARSWAISALVRPVRRNHILPQQGAGMCRATYRSYAQRDQAMVGSPVSNDGSKFTVMAISHAYLRHSSANVVARSLYRRPNESTERLVMALKSKPWSMFDFRLCQRCFQHLND